MEVSDILSDDLILFDRRFYATLSPIVHKSFNSLLAELTVRCTALVSD